MISNAKDSLLTDNPGTLPNMQSAMLDWFQILTFTQIQKTVVNHRVVETPTSVSFMGVKQPMKPEDIQLKPEGQRSWRWFTVHAFPDLILQTDDVISFGGLPYRVMGKLDYKEYGYLEYHLVQGYTGDGQ